MKGLICFWPLNLLLKFEDGAKKNLEIVYPIKVKMFMECLLMRFFMLAWGSLRAKIARWAELWSRQIVSKKATMWPKPFWSFSSWPGMILQWYFYSKAENFCLVHIYTFIWQSARKQVHWTVDISTFYIYFKKTWLRSIKKGFVSGCNNCKKSRFLSNWVFLQTRFHTKFSLSPQISLELIYIKFY